MHASRPFLLFAFTLSACTIVGTPVHPTVSNAEALDEDSEDSRLGAVTRAAKLDLDCSDVDVVLTFNRDYANVAQPRHVIDGCGKRAVYAEACEEYPRCRHLLLSLVALPTANKMSEK